MACVGKTRDDVGFAPAIGHQADHEFDRKARVADNGLAGEHFGLVR